MPFLKQFIDFIGDITLYFDIICTLVTLRLVMPMRHDQIFCFRGAKVNYLLLSLCSSVHCPFSAHFGCNIKLGEVTITTLCIQCAYVLFAFYCKLNKVSEGMLSYFSVQHCSAVLVAGFSSNSPLSSQDGVVEEGRLSYIITPVGSVSAAV